jgi:hypothetical protein
MNAFYKPFCLYVSPNLYVVRQHSNTHTLKHSHTQVLFWEGAGGALFEFGHGEDVG